MTFNNCLDLCPLLPGMVPTSIKNNDKNHKRLLNEGRPKGGEDERSAWGVDAQARQAHANDLNPRGAVTRRQGVIGPLDTGLHADVSLASQFLFYYYICLFVFICMCVLVLL